MKTTEGNKLIAEFMKTRSAIVNKMIKQLTDLYVVAKDDCSLLNDFCYDFSTAEKMCEIAKQSGHDKAEVMTVAWAMRNGYLF